MSTYTRLFKVPVPALAILMAWASLAPIQASAATFVVNSTADAVDANPGDGVCDDGHGNCTLRAAVMESNALAGADIIDLSQINNPASPITLTRHGADESFVVGKSGKATVVLNHDASIGDLNITDSVAIMGAGSGKTIIQWSTVDQTEHVADRIFHIEAVDSNITVTISGVTLRNGYIPPVYTIPGPDSLVLAPVAKVWLFKRDGGCLAVGPSALTGQFDPTDPNSDGQQVDNGPDTGFAVDNVTLSDVRVLNCISGNNGGGIYNTAPLTVNASVISGNTATVRGGGIYNMGPLNINQTTIGAVAGNSSFTANSAGEGGGIYDTGLHTANINASTLAGNNATVGGGMSAVATDVDNFLNSTISGNIAHETGAGVYSDGDVNFTNSTIANNQVVPILTLLVVVPPPPTPVAGLEPFDTGAFTYVNTLIANNQLMGGTPTLSNCGYTGPGPDTKHLVSSGHNLEDGDSCNMSKTGDLTDTNPQLAALANNGGPTQTLALAQTSPAVDAGDNSACLNNDQRGVVRPADGNLDGTFVCDIGAFEYFAATADLHIQDVTAPDTVYTSEPIVITVDAHNDPTASATAAGVVFTTSALPAGFTLTSAIVTSPNTPPGGTACGVAGGVVTCSAGDLTAGEIAIMEIQGTASTPGTLSITTTVSDTSPTDPIPANNTDTATIHVLGQSDMGVTASGPSTVLDSGSGLTMTFAAHNYGPDTAHNARVAIFLPDGLTYQSVSIGQGSCTFSSDDNSVDCLIGTVASGATVNGTLTATVDGNGSTATTFAVTADELDTNALNNAVTVGSTVTGSADLKLDVSFGQPLIREGSLGAVVVTVTNLGPGTPTRIIAAVVLPTGLSFESPDIGSDCSASGQIVTCSMPSLAVGASRRETFEVLDEATGLHTITAAVASELNDPVPANDTSSATIATSTGGGGCAFRPNSPFDPTLPAIVFLGILGLIVRSRRQFKA